MKKRIFTEISRSKLSVVKFNQTHVSCLTFSSSDSSISYSGIVDTISPEPPNTSGGLAVNLFQIVSGSVCASTFWFLHLRESSFFGEKQPKISLTGTLTELIFKTPNDLHLPEFIIQVTGYLLT